MNGECIAAWAEILKQAPTAKIRFQREVYLEPEIQRLISGRFARYGIGPERLEFVCVKPLWEAYSAFDCHLDTFPVGYVTTLYEGPVDGAAGRNAQGAPANGAGWLWHNADAWPW